jgi:hypothetical protein
MIAPERGSSSRAEARDPHGLPRKGSVTACLCHSSSALATTGAASGGGYICADELVSTSKFFGTAIAVWRHRRASFRPVTAQRISSNTLLAPRLVGLRWP